MLRYLNGRIVVRLITLGTNYMIVIAKILERPMCFFGVTFTPRPLAYIEKRHAAIYTRQWVELLWIGYPIIWTLNFLWFFLLTLEDNFAIRQDPFFRERMYCLQKPAKRTPYGWRKYFLRTSR